MNKSFNDIIQTGRVQPTDALQLIESMIHTELYNQPLRFVFDIFGGAGETKQVLTGLYNTLSPFLFSSGYHVLQNQKAPDVVNEVEPTSGSDMKSDSNEVVIPPSVVDEVSAVTEEMEEYHSIIDEETQISSESEDAAEGALSDTDTDLREIIETEEIKPDRKKEKKQMKSNAFPLSSFTKWLLHQKPLEGNTSNWQKKAGKKNKINESAQKSITPSDEIISESLALILKKQGHYLEAKKMYKKLMVKYPEKVAEYEAEIAELNTFL